MGKLHESKTKEFNGNTFVKLKILSLLNIYLQQYAYQHMGIWSQTIEST